MGRLSGKVAVVTGGASGIGASAAERFIQEGAAVVIADVQDEKGRQLAASMGKSARYLHTDVGEERGIEALVAFAVREFGRLDCMFNNAGVVGVSGPIGDTPAEGFDATMRVLLRGVFLGMKHAARVMKPQQSGSIISTASVAGIDTGLGPHVYSAAKAAIIHLTRSVAMELGESRVRVNCICPGGIATPIFAKTAGTDAAAADLTVPAMREVLAKMQPIPRAGLPEDIANAAVFLASDESSFINGHALVVDGGLTGGQSWSKLEAQLQGLRTAFGQAR